MRNDLILNASENWRYTSRISPPSSWEGTHDSIILEFMNPTNFTFTTIENYLLLCEFEEDLFNTFNPHRRNPIDFNIGNLYAVLFFYTASRAKLLAIKDDQATLHLFDSGITLMHPLERIALLPEIFARAPCFSTKGYISNIKPTRGDYWNREICTFIKMRTVNRTIVATIIGEHPILEGHEVKLSFLETGTDFAEEFIKEGWAVRGHYALSLRDDVLWAPAVDEDKTEEEENTTTQRIAEDEPEIQPPIS